ncbi:MAG: S41 family peptidase [Bacteroidales bacterium]|nr:S41 family peptidase [Bacteroidales bacterium]
MQENQTSKINSTETKQNTLNSKVYIPVIMAISIIIGIFIGNKIIPTNPTSFHSSFNVNNTGKIPSILRLIEENYVDKISTDSLEELAIPFILEKLDPHTSYLPPKINDEAHESLSGNFEGIGVQFNIQEDTVMIVNTISGGPSEKVGVLAGDRIVTINDSLFAGIGITNNDVIKHLKGPKGTKVKIGVKRKGIAELISFEITRDKIPLFSIDVSYMLNDEAGFIKISRFAGTTYSEFIEAAVKLKKAGMKKLILDLRDNGGGYLDAAVNIIDEFLPKGKMIVYTKGNFRERMEYVSTDNDLLVDIELIILINSWSASASEIVSGAIQDNDRGIIIGRRSFGKGLVQEEFEFPDRSGIRITTARYYTPVGRSIQKSYKNGIESYFSDIYHRASLGELAEADSTHFPDSLKYFTPKGKVVYGGGGIMPDIFVPVDTSFYTEYYRQITSKGLIYKFALTYADKNRDKLSGLKNADEINKYLEKQNVVKKFVDFAINQNVISTKKDYTLSRFVINTRLKAFIARNIIDNKGYFPIIRAIDTDLKKATIIFDK